MNRKSLIIKYSVSFAVGACISFIIFLIKDLFSQTVPRLIFSILCDGFFITSALMLGGGLLAICFNQGAFDGISYSFYTLFVTHNWSTTKFEDRKSFVQYREDRAEKRGKAPIFLFIVGAIFLVAAIVMLVIYRSQPL